MPCRLAWHGEWCGRGDVVGNASCLRHGPGGGSGRIGPSIGPQSYAVGDEVDPPVAQAKLPDAEQLFVYPNGPQGQAHFDLWAAQPQPAGCGRCAGGQCRVAGIHTATNTEDFFSHRAEKGTLRAVWNGGLAWRCVKGLFMNCANCKFCAALVAASFFLILALGGRGQAQMPETGVGATLPGVLNRLTNADFECESGGYSPGAQQPRQDYPDPQ